MGNEILDRKYRDLSASHHIMSYNVMPLAENCYFYKNYEARDRERGRGRGRLGTE